MRFYKFCLIKAYLDKGWSLTSYIKYAVAFFGLKTMSVNQAIWAGIGYLIFCFVLGFFWYKYRIIDAEIEVNNKFNPFVGEMRDFTETFSGGEKTKDLNICSA